MAHTDAFGVPVHIGDTVGTRTTGGRYSGTFKGEIIKLGKGQVKIRVTQTQDIWLGRKVGDLTWVRCDCAIKTDPVPPKVEPEPKAEDDADRCVCGIDPCAGGVCGEG